MQKLLQKLIATDFADLEGLQITGTIPVKQEIVNEALAEALAEGLPSPSTGAASPAAAADAAVASSPRPDMNALLKMVKRAEIVAHEGVIQLQFEIRR